MPLLPNYADGQVWDAAKVNPMTRGINMALTECTSTTRPAAIDPGHQIFETDTKRLLVHDGTGWIILYEPPFDLYGSDRPNGLFTGYTAADNYTIEKCRVQRRLGYCRVAATLWFQISGPADIVALSFVPPFPGDIPHNALNVVFRDSNGSYFPGSTGYGASFIRLYATVNSPARISNPSLTSPFTWAQDDLVTVTGEYEMTSPYS